MKYSDELFTRICERLAEGESLAAICRCDDMPAYSSVMKWVSQNEKLAESYARAKSDGLEKMADELLEIADAPVKSLDSGATDNGAVQKQRLQVDTRKWLLSKLAPKKYGDKLQTEVSGGLSVVVATGVPDASVDDLI